MHSTNHILDLLLEVGVSREDIDAIPATGHQGPISALCRAGTINETELIEKLAARLQIDAVNLDTLGQPLETKDLLNVVPPALCWKHKMLPLFHEDASVVCAFANPLDVDALHALEFSLSSPIRPVIAEESKITRLLQHFAPEVALDFDELYELEASTPVTIASAEVHDLDRRKLQAPPIVKLTEKILADAVTDDASDIHLEPVDDALDIRYRIDGVMHHVYAVPKRLQAYVLSRMKLLADMDIAERRKPQDGRIRIRAAGESIDIRASVIPTPHGEKMVLRMLRTRFGKLTLGDLGIPPALHARLVELLQLPSKVLLVTGPTGSGKTTTLYAFLKVLADGTTNIESVEDPIEYRLSGVNQIQVNEAAGITFATALRSVLRQDPDVIMVGEIRDAETADIALQAAQTGHLVLSTLHTNDAPSAITRLLNLNADPFIIASSLAGVLAQRLVRKVCKYCALGPKKGDTETDQRLLTELGLSEVHYAAAKGCSRCRYTGYRGRTGLYSYFEITPAIVDLILEGGSLSEMTAVARRQGYIDLSQRAVELLRAGVTTLEEVRAYFYGESYHEPIQTFSSEINHPVKQPAARRAQILLVEDDANFRGQLAECLRGNSFEVLEAENGEAALHISDKQKVDLVLSGLDMPKLSGRALLEQWRSNPERKEVPFIILTSSDSEPNEIELLSKGVDDFLSKKSSLGLIAARIERHLRNC